MQIVTILDRILDKMEVIYETLEEEIYLEIVLNKKDLRLLEEKKIVSSLFEMDDQIVNLGIRQIIPGEEHATA
jgi:hypothetical protein